MTDRIDQAAEALQLVDKAMVSGDPEVAVVYISAAQVLATLALVEQQRIANRLAIASIDLLFEVAVRSGHTLDFRVIPYLTKGDWASLSVVEEVRDGDQD